MKRILFASLFLFLVASCGDINKTEQVTITSDMTSEESIADVLNNSGESEDMKLLIDDHKLDVSWEDNASIRALKEILPLTINMHEYGGFEQTGPIGQSIIRNDIQMDVVPGDIVLYSGNQISVFYDNSSWSYTRLGHINLSTAELNTLLNKPSVTFVLK